MTRSLSRVSLLVLLIIAMMPFVAFAQEQESALHATVRAEVMKDPRAAAMPAAELEAMIDALAKGAEEQGMTSEDFQQRSNQPDFVPAPNPREQSSMPACDGMPQFICTIENSFGFDGSNTIIPVGLLVTSGLLWFLLYELKHHHKMGFK